MTVAAEATLLASRCCHASLAPTPRLQGGFIKNFMESVVPLIRDKQLLISSNGVVAMTRHMCEKGNGSAAVTWLLTCRGAGSTVDNRLVPLFAPPFFPRREINPFSSLAFHMRRRWVARALVACASQGSKVFASATETVILLSPHIFVHHDSLTLPRQLTSAGLAPSAFQGDAAALFATASKAVASALPPSPPPAH